MLDSDCFWGLAFSLQNDQRGSLSVRAAGETNLNTNAKGSHRLTTLLRPRSVVIVGGSEKSHTMSGAPLVNLERHGFKGKTYVVNPNRSQVGNYPSFPSIAALPLVPDTAVIVVSADRVVDALRSCVEAGISTATLVASGFGESAAGAAGEARTADLLSLIEQSQIRVNPAGFYIKCRD